MDACCSSLWPCSAGQAAEGHCLLSRGSQELWVFPVTIVQCTTACSGASRSMGFPGDDFIGDVRRLQVKHLCKGAFSVPRQGRRSMSSHTSGDAGYIRPVQPAKQTQLPLQCEEKQVLKASPASPKANNVGESINDGVHKAPFTSPSVCSCKFRSDSQQLSGLTRVLISF